MLRNYIKIGWRNLIRNRMFSIINIVGLSLSVAFCLLLFFYIRKEQSYDGFSPNKDRIFRFETTNTWGGSETKPTSHIFDFLTKDNEVEYNLSTPLIIGRDMKQNFPEVKSFTRFMDAGDQLVKINRQIFKVKHNIYADDNFFRNFSFPILKGNPDALKSSVKNVVLSENTVKKYFGNEEPLGKTIEIAGDSAHLFTVAAVAENAPDNSSIQYDIVFPIQADAGYESNISERFNHSSHMLFIELNVGVSASAFSKKINKWAQTYFIPEFSKDLKNVDFSNYKWYLRPLADCHYNISGSWGHYTDAKNIYQLACLVIVILLIASLNYILLVISNAAARSQEVGIRKTMGASRRSVIMQFWVETQIIVLISVLMGLLLTIFLLPLFNSITGSEIHLNDISWKDIIPGVLILSTTMGILAGYYPAMFLSRMKPVTILKRFGTFKINPNFSKILVVLQYTASIVLMMSAFIINRQMHYISKKDLGFDKEQVLVVSNPTWDSDFTKHMREQLRQFAGTQPFITGFSGMSGNLHGTNNINGFILNGQQRWRKQIAVDYDFFDLLGIPLLQGRAFSRVISSDTSRKPISVIVNETLFHMLGEKTRLGVYNETLNRTIIGVVKDYHFESLSNKIEPEEHELSKDFEMAFLFKIKPGYTSQAISAINNEWKKITDYPLEYNFLDETISKMYETDNRWQKTIQASCLFALFIACMGLFGLSGINAVNRTKEIGIRKVLGAGIRDIAATLSAGFIRMVTIAIIVATPLAYWIMSRWLEDFAYRIDIKWWMFAATGAIAFIIALATTSIQTIKAAIVNPVDSLRAE